MDRIIIEDLEVFANHGVLPEENVLGQKFLVSLVIYTDTHIAGLSDDLSSSVDYGRICSFVEDHIKNNTFRLIERVAETTAMKLLGYSDAIKKVEVEIKKPWAPVKLPLRSVSVKIERMRHTAYIALGSNMGDKKKYLDDAVASLNALEGCSVKKVSSWYVTAPYGVTDQDDFLNGCLMLETLMTPEELLHALNEIEKDADRVRKIHWGPRTLDLDIIFYDDSVIGTDDLCIPHIEMHKRGFVLEPLNEIAPYMRHPVTGKTVHDMLNELRETSGDAE